MTTEPTIQSYMTLCPHGIGIDQKISVAEDMMRKHGIRHLPVQVGGKLVGIVSDRDIKFAAGLAEAGGKEWEIRDVYTPEPYSIGPDTKLAEVLETMARDHIGCALVVHEGKAKGIFTMVDACRLLAEKLRTKCCS